MACFIYFTSSFHETISEHQICIVRLSYTQLFPYLFENQVMSHVDVWKENTFEDKYLGLFHFTLGHQKGLAGCNHLMLIL